MFVNLFGKDMGDYIRYWDAVSTEKYDAKKKKGTGEYIRASIPVRLSPDATDVFKKTAFKTSNKKIVGARFKVRNGWFEAVEPRDDEQIPYVRFFILDMEPVEED